VKGAPEARLTGLVAVRIAWIAAILVCAVAILVQLFSGTSGGSASRQLPGFAFSAGPDSSQPVPQFSSIERAAAMVGAAAQRDRSGRAKKGAAGDNHSASGIPPRSGTQLDHSGRGTPVATTRPRPPRAPRGDPAGAPQTPSVTTPKPPSTPPVKPPKPPEEPSVDPPAPPEEPSVDPPAPPQEPLPEPPQTPAP
jgi:hypothetical protein